MELTKPLSPSPTELIDWLNAEGLLDLDWDFPIDGDLFTAGLESAAVMQAVLAALEDQFGLELGEDPLMRKHLATPKSLAAMIAAKLV
jgi:acyl carrier protein